MFLLKLSDQIEMKVKQKQSRNGVGDKIKMKKNLGGKNKNEIQAWGTVAREKVWIKNIWVMCCSKFSSISGLVDAKLAMFIV